MRKKDIFAILFFVSIALIPSINRAGSWELEKNKAGIKVYTRSVPGSELKEFRGEVILKDTTLSSLVALLDDIGSYTKWIHNCIKAKIVKEINPRERVAYMVTKTPWPTSNRDTITHSKIEQNKNTKEIRIIMTGRPKMLPKIDDNVRVSSLKGFWLFVPLKNGSVKVVYQLHSDPGGSLPNWLANAFVVDMPFNSLRNIRKLVKLPKYKNAKIVGIIELK